MFCLNSFLTGGFWWCLEEGEVELCHARRKIIEELSFRQAWFLCRARFWLCRLCLLPSWTHFSPGAQQAGGDKPRPLLSAPSKQGCQAVGSCSTVFLEAPAGDTLQYSDWEDFASFISFGSESVQAREIT